MFYCLRNQKNYYKCNRISIFIAFFIRKFRHNPLYLHPMKIFAFIMAVIVLMLSCIQCMDSANDMGNSKANTVISKSGNSQDHTNTEDCSPFCSCNCCVGFTLAFTDIKAEPAIHASAKFYASHLPSSVIKISLPIWQPPQLAC